MPLTTRPNSTYDYVLSTDQDLAKDDQPVFVFKYVNVIIWQELAKAEDQFNTAGDTGKMIDIAFGIIEQVLVSWRNWTDGNTSKVIPFDRKKLKGNLTLNEMTELMQAGIAQLPTIDDKKKSEPQPQSDSGKSAKIAQG